jgi:hypothetical protein
MEEPQRRLDESQPHEDSIEDTLSSEKDHPRIIPYEKTRPEGDEDENREIVSRLVRNPGKKVGDRISKEEGEKGHGETDLECDQEHFEVSRISKKLEIMLQGRDGIDETFKQNQRKRIDKDHQKKNERWNKKKAVKSDFLKEEVD